MANASDKQEILLKICKMRGVRRRWLKSVWRLCRSENLP